MNACDFVGACHGDDARPGVDLGSFDESRPHAIDDVVGDKRREDLPTQAVTRNEVDVAPAQHVREVALRIDLQEVHERIVGSDEAVVQVDLGVTQDHSQLRPRQPLLAMAPVFDLGLVRKELKLTIEFASAFEVGNQSRQFVETVGRQHFAHADGLRLQVVIAQDEVRDIIGHGSQQLVAFLTRHVLLLRHGTQQDLDIDLAVGTVDAT